MRFIRKSGVSAPYIDKIFPVVKAAKEDPDGVNATAGCLYDEDGKLYTYKTVYESEKKIPDAVKANYASSPKGNDDFCEAISSYFLDGRVKNNYACMATVGGTGGLYTSIKMCLDQGDKIVIPEIAWGNYPVIMGEFNLNTLKYNIYDLNDLFAKIDECDEKAFVVINSPCQNPLGQTYSMDDWKKIMDKLNNLNKDVVLLVDCAYLDYGSGDPRNFFDLFNQMNDNVLVLLAVSCSKSFSYYGVRLGALISINNDKQIAESFINMASRLARATWSNASNGAMSNITYVLKNHYDEYVAERDKTIEMLRKRSDMFRSQAQECGLPIYPYTDGFFVTIKCEDDKAREEYHQRLLDNRIYTIAVNKGIRVAICSVPLTKLDGLAKRMKDLM